MPHRPVLTIAALALAVATLAGAGCRASGRETPSVSPRGLPTEQGALAYRLCPDTSELRVGSVRRDRARARRELLALERAFRADPDAKVRTSYRPAHEPGWKYQELTIRELTQRHLDGTRETIMLGDARARRCARQVERRLRVLLASGR